jgi:nitrogenase molybdenum-iron protein beta chain
MSLELEDLAPLGPPDDGSIIDQPRHTCSLGALQTVLAIERAVPILHAGPGCGQKIWGMIGIQNGGQGSGYTGGHTVPCSNTSEVEVVFGGEEKLRALIANSFKVLDADLFAVLTGCTPDLIGDDVGHVVREFQEEGRPIVWAESGGFRGTNLQGHEWVLQAIIEQYLHPSASIEPGLVNLWAVAPYQDPFWSGVYADLSGLVASLGLTPNVIFGRGGGVRALRKVPSAQLNLLVSPWLGLRSVELLQQRFGTPFLHVPVLPIGPTETTQFLRTLGTHVGVDPARVEETIQVREDHYYHFIERSAEVLLETRFLPRHFTTIADSTYAIALSKFLVNDLGLIPDRQYVVDGVTGPDQERVARLFAPVGEGLSPEVTFTPDGGRVHEELRRTKFRSRPLILGSSWERALAKELGGLSLSVSAPVSDRLVFDRSYVGYTGALRLVEDIYSVVLADYQ